MRRIILCCLVVFLRTTKAEAETPAPDPQMTLALLAEIRQLRLDLQTAATTIQRVQIGMYRLQAQSAELQRAKDRVQQAGFAYKQAQSQRQSMRAEIEQAEASKRTAQNAADQEAAAQRLLMLQGESVVWANREQECQAEQADAEAQFRAEEGKMNEFQDRLDRLDRLLGSYGQK
jgi:predicted  nucleic acid-binding Zn-ribbon protein